QRGLRWRFDHIVIQSWWRNCHKPAKYFEMSCGDALAAFLVTGDRTGTRQLIRVGVIARVEVQGA
ncbi:MAG TPA: hypothetical protein VIH25_00780, partial [Steroidobacteraceae bacterium]